GWRYGESVTVRDLAALGVAGATAVALAVSVLRRRAGVAGQQELAARRSARVAAMTGIDRVAAEKSGGASEFPPWLDLVAPALGVVALDDAGIQEDGPALQAIARFLVGAVFLGSVSDAMLLGHWYLVQPGLARGPLLELVRW